MGKWINLMLPILYQYHFVKKNSEPGVLLQDAFWLQVTSLFCNLSLFVAYLGYSCVI